MLQTGIRTLLGFVLAAGALGCAAQPDRAADGANAAPDRTDPQLLERRREAAMKKLPERVPDGALDGPGPVTGEVPADVMETTFQALEKLTGASRDDFEVIRAESVVWPDGALGCPQPGMVYTQATVPGYHIVLRHQGRDYDYRAGGSRYLMLCIAPDPRARASGKAPAS